MYQSKLFKNKWGLSISELMEIKSLYNAHSTAEYLLDNYCIDEDKAIKLGYEVREEMERWKYDEEEAINIIIRRNGIKER